MKKLLLLTLVISVLPFMFTSCDFIESQTIKGNGNIITQDREVSQANKMRLEGSFEVVLVPSSSTSVQVQADENLMPYIVTRVEDGWLVIKPQNHTSLSSSQKIKITVSTDRVEGIDVAGSGSVSAQDKFTGSSKLDLSLSGSGSINMNVNTPEVRAEISGSGQINVTGETQDLKVSMSGSGVYKSEQLLAENAEINISGSGDATVYADNKIQASIAGSGNVYYKGKAQVHSDIAGSGGVRRIE